MTGRKRWDGDVAYYPEAQDSEDAETHNFLYVWYPFYGDGKRLLGWEMYLAGKRMHHQREPHPC